MFSTFVMIPIYPFRRTLENTLGHVMAEVYFYIFVPL